MEKVKIPITYLVLAVVCFVVLGVLRQEYRNTVNTAEKQERVERQKSIDKYCKNVKITDLNMAMKRGMQFFEAKKYQQAAAYFDGATSLDEHYRDSWFFGGYANLKDLESRQSSLPQTIQKEILVRAKTDLAQAQKIDPLYPETSRLLAAIAKSENNDKEMSLWYARYETITGKKVDDAVLTKAK